MADLDRYYGRALSAGTERPTIPPEQDPVNRLFSREGLGSLFLRPPSYSAPAPAPAPQPSYVRAPGVASVGGMTPGGSPIPNPGPVPEQPRQVPLAALLEMMKVAPKPRQMTLDDQIHAYGWNMRKQAYEQARNPTERQKAYEALMGFTERKGLNPLQALMAQQMMGRE